MITLLEGKDKDKRNISNWRPISLINVDVKITEKIRDQRLYYTTVKMIMLRAGVCSMQ